MRIKKIMIAIAGIVIVLGLNAIATAIENPEVYEKPLPDPVPVAQLETNNHIDKMTKRYGLDSRIIKALIEEESGWCESAEGDDGNYRDALSAYNSGNTKDGRAYAERILNAAK